MLRCVHPLTVEKGGKPIGGAFFSPLTKKENEPNSPAYYDYSSYLRLTSPRPWRPVRSGHILSGLVTQPAKEKKKANRRLNTADYTLYMEESHTLKARHQLLVLL